MEGRHKKGNRKQKKVVKSFNIPRLVTQQSQGFKREASPLMVPNWHAVASTSVSLAKVKHKASWFWVKIDSLNGRNCTTPYNGHAYRKEWRIGAICVINLPHWVTKIWDGKLYNVNVKLIVPICRLKNKYW